MIDSAAIATTVSNPGDRVEFNQFLYVSCMHALTCMYVCSKKTIFNCPKCSEEISLDECFKDKAAENELKTATVKCTNQDCSWEGLGKFYMV